MHFARARHEPHHPIERTRSGHEVHHAVVEHAVESESHAGLDLNLGIIAVGAHVGYAVLEAQPASPQWVIAGLDGTIVF
ncbi:MAG: hypothetical protein ABTD50_09530 [Polyangiaceae bacterium]